MSFVGFFGPASPFSNMHYSPFEVDSVEYSCVEQYMQAQKARTFGDELKYLEIMKEKNPKAMKRLGRGVVPFDKEKWSSVAEDIVYRGLVAKFQTNAKLRDALVLTGGKQLVECSPRDRLWGAGIGQATLNKMAQSGEVRLRGKNRLGELLMRVRASL
jgi:ribA/ribD-fused uncharacterized protein